MRKIIAVAFVLSLLLMACQKEADLQDPGNGSGGGTVNPGGGVATAQSLLTRAVQVDGSDSVVHTFFYNAAGQLMRYDYTDGSDFSVNKINRNANGIITQLVISGSDISSIGLDSVVQTVLYNTGSSQYTGRRSRITLNGVTYADSTAYAYDATGNISTAVSYNQTASLPYASYEKYDYTYTAGNLTGQKIYDHGGTNSLTWQLAETFANTYDAKVNPLKLGAEAVLLELNGFFGPNNVNTVTGTNHSNAANSYSLTYAYTYNAANKPTNAAVVENPGAHSTALRFYYN